MENKRQAQKRIWLSAQLMTLFALSNLWMARYRLLRTTG